MQTETHLDAVVTFLTFDMALHEQDYPLLAELWDNAEDAEYDDA